MLPGHPCPNGSAINLSIQPMSQNPSTPESAQHQIPIDDQASIIPSQRSRSNTTNFEIMQKMNSLLGNSLNFNSLIQDHLQTNVVHQDNFGDSGANTTPNRAVGSMRAIRGSGANPIRQAEPSDTTPVKHLPPQLSENLKALLARQSSGGDFGSLISPLSTNSSMSGGVSVGNACPWPPFPGYQHADLSAYLGALNILDYYKMCDPLTWMPIVPPPTPAASRTPIHPTRSGSSPERCASTGSSSSSPLSMSQFNDIIAQLNIADKSPTSSSTSHSQASGPEANNQSEWQTIYQLRHGAKTANASIPIPTPNAESPSSSLPIAPPMHTNPQDYGAFLLAAANYFNGGGGASGTNGGNHSFPQFDPRYSPSSERSDSSSPDQQQSIEKAARIYRKAASICDATCTWSGQLPANLLTRALQGQTYSCKVFVGGVPWDITEASLQSAFSPFGPVRVEWPGKEARYAKSTVKPSAKGKGYVYMIYENDKSVKGLLENCVRDFTHAGEYYFQLTSRRFRSKEIRQVQIIPWNIGDSNFVRVPSQRLDPKKTVFVGALHGMITAEVLSNVLNDLFGGVVYAGIDTDKYKYPIGSGRVTFNNARSYQKAIAAAFVEIKSAKFSKKVQIDPYLEEATCSNCLSAPGPYFCREFMCFRYFCKTCWHNQHALDVMQSHKPLMRNTRRNQQSGGPSMFSVSGPQF